MNKFVTGGVQNTLKTVSQQVPKYLSQQWEKASEKGEVGKISIEKYVVKIVNVTDLIHGFMYLNFYFINVLVFSPSDRKQGRPEVRQPLLIYHWDWPTFKICNGFSFNYLVFINFAHGHNENVSLWAMGQWGQISHWFYNENKRLWQICTEQ